MEIKVIVLDKLEPIFLKDKEDFRKVVDLLKKHDINVFSNPELEEKYFSNDEKVIENNFLMQDAIDDYRIQSHYLGHGMTSDELEDRLSKPASKKLDEKWQLLEILRFKIDDAESMVKGLKIFKEKLIKEL